MAGYSRRRLVKHLEPRERPVVMQQKLASLREARTFLARIGALVVPYWRSEERWVARGLLAAVVFLTLGLVAVLVLLNDWNREFYNALEQRDFEAFQALLLRFGVLAAIYIVGSVYRLYLRQMITHSASHENKCRRLRDWGPHSF